MKIILLFLFLFTSIVTNANSQWIQSSASIKTTINCFAESGGDLYAGTLNDPAAIWVSKDNGVTWSPQKTALYNVSAITSLGTYLFALAESPTSLQRSLDRGVTWSNTISSLPPATLIKSMVTVGSTIIIVDSTGRFFISSDGGDTWEKTNDGSLGNQASLLAANALNPFAKNDTGLFISYDKGINWVPILSPATIQSLVISSNSIFVFTQDFKLKSTDNGKHWDTVTVPGNLLINDTLTLFAGSLGNTSPIMESSDTGKNWVSIGGPAPHRLSALIVSGPNIVEGTWTGLWYHPLHGPSSVSIENTGGMTSISPNPTNGILTIRNARENLTGISILNVLGQKVLEVAMPQTPEFQVDLSALPAGMYYARIVMGSSVEVRKVIKE
jgi:photosystem II stability/assembly factor-like uncharacterized protein